MTNQSATISRFLTLVGPLVAKNIDDRLACAKAFHELAEQERKQMTGDRDHDLRNAFRFISLVFRRNLRLDSSII